MRIDGDSQRRVPRGVVECERRQELARALLCSGPLTARDLAKGTPRSIAVARHHLRVLAAVDAVEPFLTGMAEGDEVAWALTVERLPEWAREVLLGEVSLQTCIRLLGILIFEGSQDATELAARLGICPRELARYMKAMPKVKGCEGELPYLGSGKRADRVSDLPEWARRWLDGEDGGGGGEGSRDDAVE